MAQNPKDSNADGWEIDGDMDKVETRQEAQPGRYLARIEEMQLKDVKEKKGFSGDPEENEGPKKYFNVKFELIDTQEPELEPSVGRNQYDIFNIGEKSLWKLKALISACGLDAHGSRIPNLVGCEVVLDVYEDDYMNKKNLRTKRYKNPHEGGWSGIGETRDATSDGKKGAPGTAVTKAADDTKKAPATGLAGKKAKVEGGGKAGGGKDDKEVEI